MPPIEFITFGVILDDILYPDGSTVMGALGGGGLQSAFGMRLWSPSVGVAARIGSDHQDEVLSWLEHAQIDPQAIQVTDQPTLRAWQVLEPDGRRTQVWQVGINERRAQLRRAISDLPPFYRQGCGYHLGIHLENPGLNFLAELKSLGGILSIELFRPAQNPIAQGALSELLTLADIFSANQLEASSLVGPGEPSCQANRLLEAGAQVVVIRCAEGGSLAASRQTGSMIHIPAYPARAINPVGAGNAYCGGFLVGWVQSADLHLSGCYGAVAASLLIENQPLPLPDINLQSQARRRLAALKDKSHQTIGTP